MGLEDWKAGPGVFNGELIRGEIRRNASHWHPPQGNRQQIFREIKEEENCVEQTTSDDNLRERDWTRELLEASVIRKKSVQLFPPVLMSEFYAWWCTWGPGIQIQWNSFIIKHRPTPAFYRTDLGQHQREGGAENNLTEDFLTEHTFHL